MQKIIDEITLHLNDELKKIDEETTGYLDKTERSINTVRHHLEKLKELVSNHSFHSSHDEINFFKISKPNIYSNLIFFVEVYKFHSKYPGWNYSGKRKYLLKLQKKIRDFFKENKDFYTYYCTKSSHFDNHYFLRNNLDFRLNIDDFAFDTDPNFSTTHDYKAAKIIANEKLISFINHELHQIEIASEPPPPGYNQSKLNWTCPKAALVELIYALHAAGCINNGNGDINEIARLFEANFNIELSDVYRTFLDIKMRQNPSKFIQTLQAALEKKIDEHFE